MNLSWFLMHVRPPFSLPQTLQDSFCVVTGESGCISSEAEMPASVSSCDSDLAVCIDFPGESGIVLC